MEQEKHKKEKQLDLAPKMHQEQMNPKKQKQNKWIQRSKSRTNGSKEAKAEQMDSKEAKAAKMEKAAGSS